MQSDTLGDRTLGSIDEIAEALAGVPRSAYSVPHVYPSAAPAYTHAPKTERERPAADRLRLYVHVPFCSYRCTFCYFFVKVGADRVDMERYVAALERELKWIEPGTRLGQLFMGGGTPTALPPALLDDLLAAVFSKAGSQTGDVHTVESSPETVTAEHLDVLRRHGVGRVSMGIQSLDESILASVHRRQSAEETLAACELIAGSGLTTANVDLIYGLPNQSQESFARDLRAVAGRGVNSVTLYSLRLNERTTVSKILAADEHLDLGRMITWRAFVKREAEALGFTQTRWHTFKKLDTSAALHERATTTDETMRGFQLGVGNSARSHLGYTVYRNHERIERYIERIEAGESPVEQIFPLGDADRRTQFVARSIGDGKHLDRARYAETFGNSIEEDYGDVLARLLRAGLLEDDGCELALTASGGLLYDLVTLAFYPPHARAWLEAHQPALSRSR